MGLTHQSTGASVTHDELQIVKQSRNDRVVALAGNPNVGKSTVFNALTGMNQHTGNWPGKTVTNAQGRYTHRATDFILVDIPGTYSLLASSAEEVVARDFVCFGNPDTTVVVTDATCLERNLNLVLQILEITDHVVVCVNLLDEAKKKHIHIDLQALSEKLGVPAVGTSARAGVGLDELMDRVEEVSFHRTKPAPFPIFYRPEIEKAIALVEPAVEEAVQKRISARWVSLKLLDPDESLEESLATYLGRDITQEEPVQKALEKARALLRESGISEEELRDSVVSSIVAQSESIYEAAVTLEVKEYNRRDRRLDKLLTSKATGIPIMLALLCVIFWLTITGANYPSQLLSDLLFGFQDQLTGWFQAMNAPEWLHGALVLGLYRTLAWVVSVMLPPMAIFFPLFTLMEDSGYLPRIAFNMDKFFKKANAHGKQALTMCQRKSMAPSFILPFLERIADADLPENPPFPLNRLWFPLKNLYAEYPFFKELGRPFHLAGKTVQQGRACLLRLLIRFFPFCPPRKSGEPACKLLLFRLIAGKKLKKPVVVQLAVHMILI